MFRVTFLVSTCCGLAVLASFATATKRQAGNDTALATAQWGSDHTDKEYPLYMTGDECLFCHRDIGVSWADNSHQTTLRVPGESDQKWLDMLVKMTGSSSADKVDFLLGSTRAVRFARRSKKYGQIEVLAGWIKPGNENEVEVEDGGNAEKAWMVADAIDQWNGDLFGRGCAGCHATAVDRRTRSFAATSIDCFACHGDVPTSHTEEPGDALLSKSNRDPRVVVSICGSCHLRGGHSDSTGLPYANTFVPGDNLLLDYRIDLSQAAIDRLPLVEQHIFENVRDVAEGRQADVSCISCHSVHRSDTSRHKGLAQSSQCNSCHISGDGEFSLRRPIASRKRHSNRTCGY